MAIESQTDLASITQGTGYAVVETAQGLNLRANATLEATILALMPDAAQFTVTGKSAVGFVQGSFGGTLGWAFAEYLSVQGHLLGAPIASGTTAVITPFDGVNLRAAASLDGTVLALMPSGAVFTLNGKSMLGFVEGSYDGMTGWAMAEYLGLVDSMHSLSVLWGQAAAPPLNQGFGPTDFSQDKCGDDGMYSYAYIYCPTWCPDPAHADDSNCACGHAGLDVGVAFGTQLYSPVAGTVICGGTGVGSDANSPGCVAYTCDPQGGQALGVDPGRFELELDGSGDRLILGHMSNVVVQPGQHLAIGDPIGFSGGSNGDHVHLEYRANNSGCGLNGGRLQLVDPRTLFSCPAW